jgi:uncharacterized membrane protein YhhN
LTGGALLLLGLALAAAVADWIAVDREWRTVEYVCKPLALVLLVGVALALDPHDGATRTWFVVALVLSLAGDVFLMLEHRAEGLFVAGLASFLLGHLAYVAGMIVDGIVVTRFGLGLALVALALAVVGVTILRAVRAGREPQLAGPVMAYMLVISAMVACAIGVGHPAAIAGAGLFYVSDTLIAWNRFVRELPRGRLAVMSTYHLAQAGLVVSLV